MEINEEKIKVNIDNARKIDKFRDSAVTILNANDSLFIHANIFDIKDQNIQSNLNNSQIDLNNESNIVDASRITQKLGIEEIRLRTPKSLNTEINITNEEIK